MSLSCFLSNLLEDKQIDPLEVYIVADNAKLDQSNRKMLALAPCKAEERRCRWARMKRQDSDTCLIKPRRSLVQEQSSPLNDQIRTSHSYLSILRMPRRIESPNEQHTGMRPSVPRIAGVNNATWDNVDMNQMSKKKIESSKLFSLLLSPEKRSRKKYVDPMMLGLKKTAVGQQSCW
jgi:hypothetical protein